jgi:two-component system CheB/CheR fusion protein
LSGPHEFRAARLEQLLPGPALQGVRDEILSWLGTGVAQETEERFRAFAEYSPDGLWFADARTMTLEYLSPALDTMWGVRRETILGPFDRWLELRYPPDRPIALEHLARIRSGSTSIAEHRIVRQNDKAIRWIRDYGFPIRDQLGNVQRVAGISRDITDEKDAADRLAASEERLRLIIENAREFAIFTLDLSRRITTWNTGARRVLGYSEEEIVGQSADIIFTPEDRAAGAPEHEAMTAVRDGRAGDERWHVRKDGSRLWSSGFMMPMRGPDQAVIGLIKILQDRTEAKHAHETEQREQARALAEQGRKELLQELASAQEAERRRISRELHDEIGQHVTALLLGLNELASKSTDDDLTTRLRELQSIADAVGKEVHRVGVQLRPTSLDDLGLVRALSTFVSMWSERAQIRADFHSEGFGSGRLPTALETAVYRIVQESLNNVLKHAEANTVSVILERKANEVLAIVEDDGRGFDVNAVEKTRHGQRLGLLGMNERAALNGGELRIESQPGKGTTVIMRFPLPSNGSPQHGKA